MGRHFISTHQHIYTHTHTYTEGSGVRSLDEDPDGSEASFKTFHVSKALDVREEHVVINHDL